MSKGKKIAITLGSLLLLGIATVYFVRNPVTLIYRDPIFTEEIPEKRPKRLDWRALNKFEGKSMAEILPTLKDHLENQPAELSGTTETQPSESEELLRSLPDAPIPFPGGAEPEDEAWLRSFVTGMNAEEAEPLGQEELRRFNLALAALKITPEQLPEALRQAAYPTPESEVVPFSLEVRSHEIEPPFAVGDFDGESGLEILDRGGTRMSKLSGTGALVALEGTRPEIGGDHLIPADYDQDGDLDLYLTRASGLPDSLLENDGKGNFTDVTIERGLLAFSQTSAAAWLDYDRDGRLDLLVGRSDHPLELYHQTQTGSFQPVAWDLKLWVPRGVREIEVSDFSGDGYPDFILGLNGLTDRICKNEPAETWTDWRFPDVAAEAGLTVLRNSSGHFFDFDNDGVEDLLLLSEVSDRGSPVSLYRNEGEGRFRDISEEAGLDGITNAVSASTLDLDNDGFLDLILGSPALSPNRVLWNRGGYQFREVSVAAGGSFLDRPISFLSRDIDRNGAVDLLSLNEAGNLRWLEPIGDLDSWMRVRIAGNIPGTRITMIVRDHDWILHPFHRVFGTETEVTVGVGNASTVESLALTRPGSEEPEETLTKVSPNQLVELELTRSREPKKIEPVVETP